MALDAVAVNRRHAKRRLAILATQARDLADTLDRLVDQFDREGVGAGTSTPHSYVAGLAVHEVMTFLANAHFETMTNYAAEADAESAAQARTAELEQAASDD